MVSSDELDDIEEYMGRYKKDDDYSSLDSNILQSELLAEQRGISAPLKNLVRLSDIEAENLHMKLFELMAQYNQLKMVKKTGQLNAYRSLIGKIIVELEHRDYPFNRDLALRYIEEQALLKNATRTE
jgi:hypothetical protein